MLVSSWGKKPGDMEIIFQVRVNDASGFFSDGIINTEKGFQFLILYLHQCCCFFGSHRVPCNYCCHLFTNEPYPVLGKDIPVMHVQTKSIRKVLSGDDFYHPGDFFCTRCIDIFDQCMGIGAFNNGGIEEAGAKVQVIDEPGGTGLLFLFLRSWERIFPTIIFRSFMASFRFSLFFCRGRTRINTDTIDCFFHCSFPLLFT